MGTAHPAGEAPHRYGRAFLLSAELRNADKCKQALELCEVQRYGLDSFADPDSVHLSEMPPRGRISAASAC